MRIFALGGSGDFILPTNGVRVLIITGQSNGTGRALISNTPVGEQGVKTHVNIWSSSGSWSNLDIPNNNDNGSTPGNTFHGLEVGIAKEFLDYFPGEELYIIKYGVGGTPIINHIPGGSVYESLKTSYVVPGINNLLTAGKRPFAYFYFHQGEGDADSQAEIDVYRSQLDLMTSSWESTVGLGIGTPFMYAEILELQSITGAEQINQIFQDKDDSESYYFKIQAADLTNKPGDLLHFDHDGQNNIAHRVLVQMDLQSPMEIINPLIAT